MEEVVIINYTGRYGSGNIHSLVMAKELVGLGEKVVAIVSANSKNIKDWETIGLTDLVVLKTYNNGLQYLAKSFFFNLLYKKRIAEIKNKYHIKAIYCPMCTLWTYRINKVLNTKSIVCNHDPVPHNNKKESRAFIKAYENSNCIIVHSKLFVDIAKKQYSHQRIEYMPLTNQFLYGAPDKIDQFYLKYRVNFLFFGAISDYKGLDILYDAFSSLKGDCSNISLTIAGSGNFDKYRNRYEKLSDCRIINKWIEDTEIPILFNGTNIITVAPYITATQSGVVLVAKQYKSPVIVTDAGGLVEQVIDKKTGLVVKAGDYSDLAKAMKEFAFKPNLIETMKNNIELENSKKSESDREIARNLLSLIAEL